MTPYEIQKWREIKDLMSELAALQDKLVEFYIQEGLKLDLELEKEGEGRNKLQMPEGMETELSNKDVS